MSARGSVVVDAGPGDLVVYPSDPGLGVGIIIKPAPEMVPHAWWIFWGGAPERLWWSLLVELEPLE